MRVKAPADDHRAVDEDQPIAAVRHRKQARYCDLEAGLLLHLAHRGVPRWTRLARLIPAWQSPKLQVHTRMFDQEHFAVARTTYAQGDQAPVAANARAPSRQPCALWLWGLGRATV